MSDNTTINPGSGGDAVRDIDRGTAKTQVVQLDAGGQSAESLVSQANPLPVSVIQAETATPTNINEVNLANAADTPIFVALAGDPNGDFAGVNLIEKALDDGPDGLNLNVNLKSGVLVDTNKAIRLSDGIQFTFGPLAINSSVLFDVTGYQSAGLTNTASATLQNSNDGVNFTNVQGAWVQTGTGQSGGTATLPAATWSFPLVARYLKISAGANGLTGTLVLKQGPIAVLNPTANIGFLGATTVVTAGVNGMLAVGGNIAPGYAQTPNPLVAGAIDPANLTRRLQSDNAGRLLLAGQSTGGVTPSTNTTPVGVTQNAQSPQNLGAVAVQEQGQVEGQSRDELLVQLLLEQRIANQIAHETSREIIRLLSSLQGATSFAASIDPPENYRADPSAFVQ